MINNDTLDILNEIGIGANVDELETYLEVLMESYSMGEPLVEDSQFDILKKILSELKPESKVLLRNNETEEEELCAYDSILDKYGMCSIHTIDSIDLQSMSNMAEIVETEGQVDIFASLKQNGHATRLVYRYGELVSGTTRGRYKKGRDITRHFKLICPNTIAGFKNMPLVEIRGEMVVTNTTFEEKLRHTGLKTPLSSVTSLIRDSASDEEIKMLKFIAYKIIPSDEQYSPKSLSQEFAILEKCGFTTPPNVIVKSVEIDNLTDAVETILEHFESYIDSGDYDVDCDGIVVAINNNDIFYSYGKEGNTWKGNFALKDGKYWQSSIYKSTIEKIRFKYGKKYITPIATVKPVICKNGAQVTSVPLYNIGVMQRYKLYTGQEIHFRFGGEQGVTLCTPLGNSVRVD